MSDSLPTSLRVLSVCHYVLAALTGLCSLFSFIYIALGLFIPTSEAECNGGPCSEADMVWFRGIFVVIGVAMFVLCVAIAMIQFMTGKNLAHCKGWMFCIVVAAIECLSFPIGTILGVSTIVVLVQEENKRLFGK